MRCVKSPTLCSAKSRGWRRRNRNLGVARLARRSRSARDGGDLFLCGEPDAHSASKRAGGDRPAHGRVHLFHSANAYACVGNLPAERFEVEFQGSNDSGETWRSFEFRYKIQRTDRVAPFIAPWYPRFDAILQNVRVAKTTPELYASTAAHLILRDAPVMDLFVNDPFPERPPTMVRMAEYKYHLNGSATWRATGDYWRREYLGDWLPTVYRNARGEIVSTNEKLNRHIFPGLLLFSMMLLSVAIRNPRVAG